MLILLYLCILNLMNLKKHSIQFHCIFYICLFLFLAKSTRAQITPKNKSSLNYTQIMFEYNEVKNAVTYNLQLSYNNDSIEPGKIIQVKTDSSTATLITGLMFGKSYKWNVLAYNAFGKLINTSDNYYFNINGCVFTDTSKYRILINKNISSNPKELIWIDYFHAAFDKWGRAVWYIANPNGSVSKDEQIRNLKMSPKGTVTFLTGTEAYDIDINGNILWKAPNDGKISGKEREFYHHDFNMMANGNYMVLGQYYENRKPPNTKDTALCELEIGTVIEYDSTGKISWSWNSKDYFTNEELFYSTKLKLNDAITTHMNAFSVDEACKYVYVGFRNINRIIKIEKKTGKVIASYGSIIDKTKKETIYGNNFFNRQHDAYVLSNNNIVVLNNDNIDLPEVVSSVVIFNQKSKTNLFPKKVWEFKLNFDTLTNGKSFKMGNVTELKNGNLLVCEGAINRIIEVTPKKEIVWDAFTEEYYLPDKKWIKSPQYRASFSSSLYPYYFTVNSIKKDSLNNKHYYSFQIVNEGTEQDKYEIMVYKGNSMETQLTTDNIGAHKKTELKIYVQNTDNISIKIKSLKSGKIRKYTTAQL